MTYTCNMTDRQYDRIERFIGRLLRFAIMYFILNCFIPEEYVEFVIKFFLTF